MYNLVIKDTDININNLYTSLKQIASFYSFKNTPQIQSSKSFSEIIDQTMYPLGIFYTNVNLNGSWYKESGINPILCLDKKNNRFTTLFPCSIKGYKYYDQDYNCFKKVTKRNFQNFSSESLSFYKPLPNKNIKILNLIKQILKSLSLSDYITIIIVTLLITAIGYLSPAINKYLFSYVVQSNDMSLLYCIFFTLIGITISSTLFNSCKTVIISRIQTKMNIYVQPSSIMRLLQIPVNFFRNYSAGELNLILGKISNLCSTLEDIVFTTGLTSIFSFVYIFSILNYAPSLVIPSILIFVITALFIFLSVYTNVKINSKLIDVQSKQSGFEFSIISGIQKLKTFGSEENAFKKWTDIYKKSVNLQYNPPYIIKLYNPILLAITLFGTIIIYFLSVKSKISVGDYMAFNVSYGLVSGAFNGLVKIALSTSSIKPIIEFIKPIIEAPIEVDDNKKIVSDFDGNITLKEVSFQYNKNDKLIINKLNLKIKQGQYVAIVGKTGCGKSTLLRLILGFEKPTSGEIYFDNYNANDINLKLLRKKIGTVLQDSKLFQGDIFSNIAVSSVIKDKNVVIEAAKIAEIYDDIIKMPMGMNTIISESSNGGISGGQKQRILIARAIAKNPKILLLDEATSALDNITQDKIACALNKFHNTRIVVAHRLSTIKHCDRIIMLENGRIVEDGTYDDLIANHEKFYELVKSQQTNC